jgi:hypothetical protein
MAGEVYLEVVEMNSSRRWLFIFTIVIGILVIAAVSLVLLTKGNKVTLLAEDSPQGVVQRYLIAIQEKDYQQAFNYFSFNPTDKIMTYNDWLMMVGPQASSQSAWKAALGKVTLNGNNATVEVTIDTARPGGLFGNSQTSQLIIFQLTKTANSWWITSPTYVSWIY